MTLTKWGVYGRTDPPSCRPSSRVGRLSSKLAEHSQSKQVGPFTICFACGISKVHLLITFKTIYSNKKCWQDLRGLEIKIVTLVCMILLSVSVVRPCLLIDCFKTLLTLRLLPVNLCCFAGCSFWLIIIKNCTHNHHGKTPSRTAWAKMDEWCGNWVVSTIHLSASTASMGTRYYAYFGRVNPQNRLLFRPRALSPGF